MPFTAKYPYIVLIAGAHDPEKVFPLFTRITTVAVLACVVLQLHYHPNTEDPK